MSNNKLSQAFLDWLKQIETDNETLTINEAIEQGITRLTRYEWGIGTFLVLHPGDVIGKIISIPESLLIMQSPNPKITIKTEIVYHLWAAELRDEWVKWRIPSACKEYWDSHIEGRLELF